MATTTTRRLVVTADTSSLPKAANEVQRLGAETGKTSAILAAAKGSMPTAEYKALAASLAPAIAAEKAMAAQAREVERALKPLVAEQRKLAAEALKQEAVMAKRTLSEQKAANALRMRHDIEFANAQRMLRVQQDVDHHLSRSNLTIEQGNTILAGAALRYRQMGQQADAANQNIRLTSHQTTNLGYQLNDIATMMAMGASPFQIISSQAGQVVQALGDGPGGVRGSLAAIGSSITGFARMMGPVGFAIAGATAAAGALWWMSSGSEAKEAKNSVDEYRDLVDRLKDSYAGVSAAAAGVWERASIPTANMALGELHDAARQAREELEEAGRLLGKAEVFSPDTSTIGSARAVLELFNGEVSTAKNELRDLYGQFVRGEIDARAFADAAARIQISPTASERTRELTAEVRKLVVQFGAAAANAQAIEASIEAMTSGKEGRLVGGFLGDIRERFGDVGNMLDRMNPEGIDAIREGLAAQTEELTGATKAADEYAKAIADMRAGWSDTASDLQREIDLYGQSEGAIAAARFEYEAFGEARRAAADADQIFDETGADAQRIREVAAEIGALTDRLEGMRQAEEQAKKVRDVLADLEFQGSLIGLPQIDADIARQLRTLNVEIGSFEGKSIDARMRLNDEMEKTNDALEKQHEFMSNIVSTGLDALFDTGAADTFFDRVMDGLADVGAPFTNDLSALFQEDAE